MGIFAISSAVEEASGPPALFPMTEEEAPGSFSVNLITREEAPVCSGSSTSTLIDDVEGKVQPPKRKSRRKKRKKLVVAPSLVPVLLDAYFVPLIVPIDECMAEPALLDDFLTEVLPLSPLYVPFTAEELSDIAGTIRTIRASVREISGSEQRRRLKPGANITAEEEEELWTYYSVLDRIDDLHEAAEAARISLIKCSYVDVPLLGVPCAPWLN